MKKLVFAAFAAAFAAFSAFGGKTVPRPVPRPALLERMVNGPDIIGIVHWGLNTYTDREWGYGDVDPKLLNPVSFDADQIVGAAKAGGIGGLVIVAKHHDGFCLWPTKTTDYNIARSPFGRGAGNGELGTGRDYVKEMSETCRKAGLKFGVYVSPWDRHDADYAGEKYVEKYHAQIKELLGGDYGEVFEMWFDGANGGDGWYGGAKEKRTIGKDYYRLGEVMRFVRELQPGVTIFGGGSGRDFRWPQNERGILDPDSRATCPDIGRMDRKAKRLVGNRGSSDGEFFHVCEADFPLRKGWFWHERENGTTKSAAYLTKLYLSSVGNGGTMNIGLAPNKDGVLDDADVQALAGFGAMRRALFAHEAIEVGEPFNVVVMSEDISKGERVDEWEFVADGTAILRGKSIGAKRIRLLETPCAAKTRAVNVLKGADGDVAVSFRLYFADPELVRAILDATAESGETDTAKWMTASDKEELCPVSENVRGHENVEWQIAYAFHLTDEKSNLPRVLLVGDSICNGYQGEVRRLLDGKMNVSYWISSYCVTSPNYMKFLSLYLDEAKYDVVHFNNGLHSLQTSTDAYANGIRAALELVGSKQPKAKIVWCSSTPLKDAEKTAKAKELNEAAAKVVAEIGSIETNDLFALLDPLDRDANWSDVFHHKKETCKMEARQVADAVLRVVR